MINDALQGKFRAAGNDLARLVVNTTVGFGGLLDPATQMGLDKNDEDFGQTLGPLGRSARAVFGDCRFWALPTHVTGPPAVVDLFTGPTHYISNNWVSYGIYRRRFDRCDAGLLSLR